MAHREGSTGDSVLLNMIHGTHYQAGSKDEFAVGKTWGPWLWYLVSSIWASGVEIDLFITDNSRMMGLSPMPEREPEKKMQLGHIAGIRMSSDTIPVGSSLVDLYFQMDAQQPELLYL
jgi:hypothetical protein